MAASEAATRGVPKKRCFKNFAKFTGKHLCQSLFFNKEAFTEHLWTTASTGWESMDHAIIQTGGRAANTWSNFSNSRPSLCFSLQAAKARQSIWKTRLRILK